MSRPKGSKNKKTLELEKEKAKEKEITVSINEQTSLQIDMENNSGGVNKEKNTSPENIKILPENYENTSPENNFDQPLSEDNFEYENELPPEPSRMRSKSNEKKVNVCKRCGKELIVTPCRIDTNMIAGRVSTHREHPRFVTICMECATELSEVVDKWLGDYPTKWEDHSDGY